MSEGQPIGNELTTEHSLEGVAKGLAQGTVSRRKALGVVGTILGGSLLALIPGMALAQPPGNQPACVRCCKRAFDPGEKVVVDGQEVSAQGNCISQSAITGVCQVPCEDNGNGNGNNGECDKYKSRRVCVPRCPEGFRINVVTTGTDEGVTTTVTCVSRTTTPV